MANTQPLNNQKKCDKVEQIPQQSTELQIVKLLRRIQALADGRHEIIVTCDSGVKDWTVRAIGKVEK